MERASEHRIQVFGIAHLENDQLDLEPRRSRLGGAELPAAGRRIPEQPDATRFRRDTLQQFQPFSGQIGRSRNSPVTLDPG